MSLFDRIGGNVPNGGRILLSDTSPRLNCFYMHNGTELVYLRFELTIGGQPVRHIGPDILLKRVDNKFVVKASHLSKVIGLPKQKLSTNGIRMSLLLGSDRMTVLHTAYLTIEVGNTPKGEPLPNKYTHHPLAVVLANPGPAYELGKAIDGCRPATAAAELGGTLHVEGGTAQVGWADLSSKRIQHERQAVARTTEAPQFLSPTPGPAQPMLLLLPQAQAEEDPASWVSTLVRGQQPAALHWRLTATFTLAQPGQLQPGRHTVPCELYPYRYLPKSAASPAPGVAGTISARGYVACDTEATVPKPPHTVTAAVEVLADGRVIVQVPLQGEAGKTWLAHLSAGAGGNRGDGNQVFLASLLRLPCPPTAVPASYPLAIISPPVLFANRVSTGQKRERPRGSTSGTGAASTCSSSSSAGVESEEEDREEAEGEDDPEASMGAGDMPVLGSGTGTGVEGGTGRRVRSPSLSSVTPYGSSYPAGLGLGMPTCAGMPMAPPLDADVLQPAPASCVAHGGTHEAHPMPCTSGTSCTTASAVVHAAGPAPPSPWDQEDDDWFLPRG